jgi:hypothetical protein
MSSINISKTNLVHKSATPSYLLDKANPNTTVRFHEKINLKKSIPEKLVHQVIPYTLPVVLISHSP